MKKIKYLLIIILLLLAGVIYYNHPKTNIVKSINYKAGITSEKAIEAIKTMADAYYNHKDYVKYESVNHTNSTTKVPYNPTGFGKTPEYANADNPLYYNSLEFIYNLFNLTFSDSNGGYKLGGKGTTDVTYESIISGRDDCPVVNDSFCVIEKKGEVFSSLPEETRSGIVEQFNNYFTVGDVIVYRQKDTTLVNAYIILDKTGDGKVVGLGTNGINYTTYSEIKNTFTSTTSTTAWDYYIIRPYKELGVGGTGNYTVSTDVTNRLKAPALTIDKTITPKQSQAVKLNDTISYKITLKNNSTTKIEGIKITDTIPAGTTFVSATDGDSKLTWNISLDANKSKEIIIKVKVKNDKSLLNKKLSFDKTAVNDITLNKLDIMVAKTPPVDTIKSTIDDLVGKSANGGIANTVYNELDKNNNPFNNLTIDEITAKIFDITTLDSGIAVPNCATHLDSPVVPNCVTETSNKKYTIKSTADKTFGPMLVKELSGGYHLYLSPDNRIYRPKATDFLAGDVLIIVSNIATQMYIAAGDNSFAVINNDKVAKLSSNELTGLLNALPHYYLYYTLRPSYATAASVISSSFISKPTKLQYTKDDKTIDLSGGVAKLVYDTGYIENVTLSKAEGVEIVGYSTDELGEKTVTIKLNGATLTLPIEIIEGGQGGSGLPGVGEDDPPGGHHLEVPDPEDGTGTGEVHLDPGQQYESVDNPDTGFTSVLIILIVLALGYFSFRFLVKKNKITFKI